MMAVGEVRRSWIQFAPPEFQRRSDDRRGLWFARYHDLMVSVREVKPLRVAR